MHTESFERKFILDADILSALVKIGRFEQFLQAFNVQTAFIPPMVYQELQDCAVSPKRILQQLARNIEQLVATEKIGLVEPTDAELAFVENLPECFGRGERQAIAICFNRSGLVLLSNEVLVKLYCDIFAIKCLTMPFIVRALWLQNIISAGQVDTVLGQLKQATRMQLKAGTKDIILAPHDKNREVWFYFNEGN
jgi:predicted nucleic acid-binding protein